MKKICLFVLILFNFLTIKLIGQSSESGYILPVEGEIKVLIVWAKKTSTFTNTTTLPGYGTGNLPLGVDDYFDASFTVGIEPTGYITKYFYEQSFGQYIVTGDYLNHVVEVANLYVFKVK